MANEKTTQLNQPDVFFFWLFFFVFMPPLPPPLPSAVASVHFPKITESWLSTVQCSPLSPQSSAVPHTAILGDEGMLDCWSEDAGEGEGCSQPTRGMLLSGKWPVGHLGPKDDEQ